MKTQTPKKKTQDGQLALPLRVYRRASPELLRRYLQEKGIRQSQFAKEVGVTQSAVSLWLSKGSVPAWVESYCSQAMQAMQATKSEPTPTPSAPPVTPELEITRIEALGQTKVLRPLVDFLTALGIPCKLADVYAKGGAHE